LYKQAQSVAQELATEVKDSEDTVLSSLENNTQISISLINSAAEGMKSALEAQGNSLASQQQVVRGEIDQTANALKGLSTQMDSISGKGFAGWGDAAGWDDAKWESFWDKFKNHNGNTFADGGLTNGPSHAQGGIPIEVEGGEHIQPVHAVKYYGKKGLDFLEGFRHKVFPKSFFADLGLRKMSFATGGSVPKISMPKFSLPSFSAGGTVSGETHTYQFNLNVNGKNHGPFVGQKNMVEGVLNELKKAQRLT
jgi:hypothetical protein